MIEVNIRKWNVVMRYKIESSISLDQLNIWMYTKCSGMLHCFQYLTLRNIYFSLKNVFGNRSICDKC